MNIYTPYVYLIGWSELDKWYYGVRHAKGCHPNDFWVKYFTSSFDVQLLRKQFGNPDIIQIRRVFKTAKDALAWETKVLRRMNVSLSERWINNRENRWPLKNEETIKNVGQKLSQKFKGRKAITDGVNTRYINLDNLTSYTLPEGWQWGKPKSGPMSDKQKHNISQSRKGQRGTFSGKKHSDETKSKMSDSKKGRKRGPMSDEHKQKISSSRIGKSPSNETRRKISMTLKNRNQS